MTSDTIFWETSVSVDGVSKQFCFELHRIFVSCVIRFAPVTFCSTQNCNDVSRKFPTKSVFQFEFLSLSKQTAAFR